MTIELWFLFAITVASIIAVPGPSVLLVVSNAIKGGMIGAIATVVGNAVGITLWAVAAASGFAALMSQSPQAGRTLQIVGAGYLVYVGLKMLNSVRKAEGIAIEEPPNQRGRAAHLSACRDGFVCSLGNPSSVVFFSAIFPQFVDPDGNLDVQIFILISTNVMLLFTIYLVYAYASVTIGTVRLGRRLRATQNYLIGFLLLVIGLRIVLRVAWDVVI